MSYWSHNPELYDEIITKALSEEWREKVESGEVELTDVPEDIFYRAAVEGEREYWAELADDAKMRRKT